MRKILFIVFAITANLSVAQTPIGYWPFNGTPNDESGNGYNGTVTGAVLAEDRYQETDKAYTFDGDDYITIGDIGDIKTFSVWFYLDNLSFAGNIISVSDGNFRFTISVYHGTVGGRTYTPAVGNWTTKSTQASTGWHHIAATTDYVDQTTLKVYLDGVEINGSDLINGAGGEDRLVIGASNNYSGGFIGKIDDVRVYDQVLTESQITALFNESGSGPLPGNAWQNNGDNIFYYNTAGNVAIGTDTPEPGYHLSVKGKIVAEEIKVDVHPWSDFVFKPEYELKPLKEIDAYIKQNGHLPEIPSEKEVGKNGISIGEMNAKLLQKIEELTLYMIEQDKNTRTLIKRVDNLEKENKELKNQIRKNEQHDEIL